jgi:hypothetical protein
MTKRTVITPPSTLRFVLIGGFTATQYATFISIFIVFLDLTLAGIYYAVRNGLQAIEPNSTNPLTFLASVVILVFLAILLSWLPAFLGGALLAWLLMNNGFKRNYTEQRRFGLGLKIGVLMGVILALLFLTPSIASIIEGWPPPHNVSGYSRVPVIMVNSLYVIEIIVAAVLTGEWTEHQLRLRISARESVNAA